MPSQVAWNIQMSVREGRMDDARALMTEMVESTRREPGALIYDWYLAPDGSACHIDERYVDSGAALVHLEHLGAFAERFLACFQPTSLSVYGEPSDEARAALVGFAATYLEPSAASGGSVTARREAVKRAGISRRATCHTFRLARWCRSGEESIPSLAAESELISARLLRGTAQLKHMTVRRPGETFPFEDH